MTARTGRILWRAAVSALVTVSAVGAQAPRQEPANAALVYWQAFAAMPKSGDVPRNLWQVALNAKAMAYLRSAPSALEMLHRASRLDRCDWGLQWDRGPMTAMPHMAQARTLARLACFRARLRLSQGDSRGALEDLLAVLRMARHVGRDASLIGVLVQASIEATAVDGIAQNFGRWPDEDLAALRQALDRLPEGGSVAAAMDMEAELYGSWLRRRLLGQDDQAGVDAAIDQVVQACEPKALKGLGELTAGELSGVPAHLEAISDAHYAQLALAMRIPKSKAELLAPFQKVEAMLRQVPADEREHLVELIKIIGESQVKAAAQGRAGRVVEMIDALGSLQSELAQLSARPYREWVGREPAFREKLAQADPLSRRLLKGASGVYLREAAAKARLAMLAAAAVWRREGEDAFQQVQDPYGDGPFALSANNQTAEITSELELEGKPVKLTVRLHPLPQHKPKPDSVTIRKIPQEAKVRSLLAQLRRYREPDAAAEEELRREFGRIFRDIGRELPDFQVDDATADQALRIFVEGAKQFAGAWVPIVEEGLTKDGSARRAAVLLAAQERKAAMFRYTMSQRRADLDAALGADTVAAILRLLP